VPNPPNHIQVGQFGGPFKQPTGEEVAIQIAWDPLLKPGERGVFFLVNPDKSRPYTIAGSRGHYTLAGGRVYPISLVTQPGASSWASQLTGKDEQTFLQQVQALAGGAPSQ
jgi:hypothetical protein